MRRPPTANKHSMRVKRDSGTAAVAPRGGAAGNNMSPFPPIAHIALVVDVDEGVLLPANVGDL